MERIMRPSSVAIGWILAYNTIGYAIGAGDRFSLLS